MLDFRKEYQNINVSKNFKLYEFIAPSEQGVWIENRSIYSREDIKIHIDEFMYNIYFFAGVLQGIRNFYDRPVIITSGFRTWAHHIDVYKRLNEQNRKHERPEQKITKDSLHLHMQAVDFWVQGVEAQTVQKHLDNWHGGLGCYRGFTHIDIGSKRRF